jgi:hypothetical protein
MPMSGRFLKNLPKRSLLRLFSSITCSLAFELHQPFPSRFCASASQAPITLPVIFSSLHGTTLRHYRLGGILGRVHRRERWWARCPPSKAAQAEAVRIGRVVFCETNPTFTLERSQGLKPPWKVRASHGRQPWQAPLGAPRSLQVGQQLSRLTDQGLGQPALVDRLHDPTAATSPPGANAGQEVEAAGTFCLPTRNQRQAAANQLLGEFEAKAAVLPEPAARFCYPLNIFSYIEGPQI